MNEEAIKLLEETENLLQPPDIWIESACGNIVKALALLKPCEEQQPSGEFVKMYRAMLEIYWARFIEEKAALGPQIREKYYKYGLLAADRIESVETDYETEKEAHEATLSAWREQKARIAELEAELKGKDAKETDV